MQLNKYSRFTSFGLVICSFLMACGEMDETYKEYVQGGEIIYTGKVDSVETYSGNERIKLSWILAADPKISYCKVFWNNGTDSIRVPVQRSAEADTINVILDDMEEGVYTFDIYTGDDAGHTSLKVSVSGRVYGELYAATLPGTSFTHAKWSDDKTTVEWLGQEGNAITLGLELDYTDNASDKQKVFVPAGTEQTVLANYKKGTEFRYRTLYLPDSAAIDTFSTEYLPVEPLVEHEMDKSAFAEHILPTDALSAWGWLLSMLWDGNTDSPNGFHTPSDVGFPHHYTFDLGVETQLSRYKTWQRGATSDAAYLYSGGNPLKWEVWGTTEPAADGSWTGWTKLLDCESVKPSGLPEGQNSDEDKAYALAGEEFHFPSNVPPVRYIRVKVISNWRGDPFSHAMEMTFWEIEKQ